MTRWPTRYDLRLGARTVGLALTTGMVLCAVVVSTDEAGSSWPARVARVAALLPVAGAIAAYVASDQAESRGEVRVHASLGAPRAKATCGCWFGGALIGLVGAVLLVPARVDLRPLFPRVVAFEEVWSHEPSGWVETSHGLRVEPSGQLGRAAATVRHDTTSSAPPRIATFFAVALAAIAFPFWSTARAPFVRRLAAMLAVVAASVTVFHLVAAQRVWPGLLALPPLLALLEAAQLHTRQRWA